MKVEVLLPKWGNYAKGDTLEISDETTAKACIKAGAVKDADAPKAKEPKKEAKK